MSSRERVRVAFRRYRILTIPLLEALTGLGRKNVERIVAVLRRDGIIRPFPFLGNQKIYTPTARGATRLGLDPRKHGRAPGVPTIFEHLLVAAFCAEEGHTLLTPGEFAELLPEQAACPGAFLRRYLVDGTLPEPLLTVIVPDFGTSARRCARRARREIDRRKRHQHWRDLIFHRLLRVLVVTPFGEAKAAAVMEQLNHDTFPHAAVAVRGVEGLFIGATR